MQMENLVNHKFQYIIFKFYLIRLIYILKLFFELLATLTMIIGAARQYC